MTKFTFATSKEKFDHHIELSIRGYINLWSDVLSLSKYFVEDYTEVVDLGCSTGKLLKAMIKQNKEHIPQARYTGIEIEEEFFKDYEKDLNDYDQLNYFKGDVENMILKIVI